MSFFNAGVWPTCRPAAQEIAVCVQNCPIFVSYFDEISKTLSNLVSNFWWDLSPSPKGRCASLMRFAHIWPANDTAVLYCSYWLQGHNIIQKGDGIEAEHTHNLMEATCHAWNVQFIVSNSDEISSLCPIFLSNFWWDFDPMSNFSVQFLMRWQKTKIGLSKKK